MMVYIDNILVMADTAAQVKSHLEALMLLLIGLEFIINIAKSTYHHSNPKNQLLGFEGRLYIPVEEKLNHMSMEVSQYLQ